MKTAWPDLHLQPDSRLEVIRRRAENNTAPKKRVFNLIRGPWMLWFGQAMIDVARGAGVLEGVCPDRLSGVDRRLDIGHGRAGVAGRGEVGAVIGEHRMHLVGHGGNEMTQEIRGGAPRDLLVQLDKGDLEVRSIATSR